MFTEEVATLQTGFEVFRLVRVMISHKPKY